nr:MAG: putative nucleocapsid [Wufeng shrew chuvirus 6]
MSSINETDLIPTPPAPEPAPAASTSFAPNLSGPLMAANQLSATTSVVPTQTPAPSAFLQAPQHISPGAIPIMMPQSTFGQLPGMNPFLPSVPTGFMPPQQFSGSGGIPPVPGGFPGASYLQPTSGGGGGGGAPPPGWGIAGAAAPRLRHINDELSQIIYALPSRNYVSQIIGVNLGLAPVLVDPLTGHRNSRLLYRFLYLASRGEAYLQYGTRNLLDNALLFAIANLVAPNIPDSLPENAAQERLRLEVAHLMKNESTSSIYFEIEPNVYLAAVAVGGSLHLYHGHLPATWGEFETRTLDELTALMTPLSCAALLCWIIDVGSSTRLTTVGTLIYVLIFVSFSKRGSITPDKIDKIKMALKIEIGVDVPMRSETITQVYSVFGSYINRNNAAELFNAWGRDVTGLSLRMQITLQQSLGSGLTGITAIRQAFITFPDFCWGEIVQLIPADATNAEAAFIAINNNPYYAFSSDMGPAASAKYKNLTYVAKELLIKYGGDDYRGLTQFQGFTRNPLGKNKLDALIANYDPTLAVMDPAALSGQVTRLSQYARFSTNLM